MLYLVNHDVYKTFVRLEKLFNYLKSTWAILGIWNRANCLSKMVLVWQCFEKIWLWTHWIVDINTKLLQVVSLQKLFLKSNGAQISDLIRFEGSKCVDVSNLNVSGSRVFHMFWGIQRLQICRNWMYKTKVMIYLVQKCNLNYLKISSKFCTVTMSRGSFSLAGTGSGLN
jgi:hypothetical protein